jgi:polyferredoxin
MSLQNLRRIYSVFFFALFVYLLIITDFRNLKGYEVSLFLEINPLVSIFTFFTSGIVYKGLVLSLLIIIPTLFLGRFFCSWICPLGILNQWIGYFLNKKKTSESHEENVYRKMFRFKYYVLVLFAVLAISGSLQIGLLDPIAFISRSFIVSGFSAAYIWGKLIYLKQPVFHGGILITLLFLTVLFANRFMNRFWCKVICPLGALLGILSFSSLLRIRRDVEKCTDCKKCLPHCQGGCDPHSNLRINECHVCMNCISACPEDALHYGLAGADSSVH